MRLYVGNNPVDATYYGNSDIKRTILYQGGAESTVSGESPLVLPNALPNSIYKLVQYGKCEQSTTPAPNAPADIECNNGSLKLRHKSGLPLGYKLLDYVGSSGAAYIITNTKLASTDIIESEFRNSSTTGYGALYGIFAVGQSSAFYANQTYYGYNAANSKVDTDINVDTDWHTVRHDFVNGTLTIDNTTTTFTPFEFENTTNNAILARYYNNSYGYIWKGRIRKFKVTRNNEVICDLLPAKNSNDELGLYDLANNTFFTATTGSLSEGNEIDDYELIDGTPEEISIGGKNLNAGTLDHVGYTSTGDTSTSTTFAGTLCQIPTKEGEKFTVSCGNITDGISGVFINTWLEDGSWNTRQAIAATSGTLTYTVGAGVGLINFTLYKTDGVKLTSNSWMQVEYGSTATGHVPYTTPQTASVADLFAVGDYKDEQDIITGEVARNIGIKVFNGTESYSLMTYGYATDELSDFPNENFMPLCTHFVGKTTASAAPGTIRLYFTSGGVPRTYFFVDQTVDDFSTVDKFKAWLATQYAAGTPIIVVYPLAESTSETVTPQELYTAEGKNTIAVVSNVSDVSISSTYLTVHSDE